MAFVVTSDRLMPRWTIVCAICGTHAADDAVRAHQVGGSDRLSRCWATTVSTVGTPVMSMMVTRELVLTIASSSDSIRTCVRALSNVPMTGRASIPLHSFTHGRGQFQQFFLLVPDNFFARL